MRISCGGNSDLGYLLQHPVHTLMYRDNNIQRCTETIEHLLPMLLIANLVMVMIILFIDDNIN